MTMNIKEVNIMSHVNYSFTEHFKENRSRHDRRNIKMSWINDTIQQPDRWAEQKNGNISHWKYISAVGKCLRVICLRDGQIHTVYFDRDEKKKFLRRMKDEGKTVRNHGASKYYAY